MDYRVESSAIHVFARLSVMASASVSLPLRRDRNWRFSVEVALNCVLDLPSAWYGAEKHDAKTGTAGIHGPQCGKALCGNVALHSNIHS